MRDPRDDGPSWRRYLRFWGSNVDADVDDEIAFHLDELAREYEQSGVPPDEAHRLAQRRFGDRTDIARSMRSLAHHQEVVVQRTEWVDAVARDVRYALRQLAQRPAFTAAAVLTLALGIGANTAIFSAVDAVLLHPVATRDVGRLMIVRTSLPKMNLIEYPVGPGEAFDLMARRDLFDASTAWSGGGATLTGRGDSRRITVTRTLGHFFDVFAVAPRAGRFYRVDESQPGTDHVAVVSYALSQALGGDASVLGQTITLSGTDFRVVGVMPRGFDYPRGTDVYVPQEITPQFQGNRGQMIWNVVGRIKDGLTQAQFDAGIQNEQARWHADPRWSYAKMGQYLTPTPLVSFMAGELRPVLLVLFGAVGLVLLIACANIASLQLVHAIGRSRELAVRTALGASRGAIMRQLLIENIVLSLAGGALGVGIGVGLLRTVSVLGARDMPALAHMRVSGPALAFTAAATIVVGVMSGLIPAWRAGRADLRSVIQDGARTASLGGGRSRVLQASVVVQVALTVMLLIGSSLMLRSLARLLARNPGFDAEHVATMRVSVAGLATDGASRTSFWDALIHRLSAVPAFGPVGVISELPFSGDNDSSPFTIRGRAPDPSGPTLHANEHTIGGAYFRAMGIPLLRGRLFDSTDAATPNQGAWVAIVDETFAKTFFPHEDPIGRRINQGSDATIIGVVGTVSQTDLGDAPKATVYYPYTQHDWFPSLVMVTRTAMPIAGVQSVLRSALGSINPKAPIYDARTLDDRISASVAPRRMAMLVLSGLAALALALAVFGLYGVVSYAVSQRRREFGIRLALGAQTGDVRAMVVRQGIALAAVGLVIGLAGAFAGSRALQSILFQISVHDPVAFTLAPVALAAVAVAASYLPARRATRVEPVEVLRST